MELLGFRQRICEFDIVVKHLLYIDLEPLRNASHGIIVIGKIDEPILDPVLKYSSFHLIFSP